MCPKEEEEEKRRKREGGYGWNIRIPR